LTPTHRSTILATEQAYAFFPGKPLGYLQIRGARVTDLGGPMRGPFVFRVGQCVEES